MTKLRRRLLLLGICLVAVGALLAYPAHVVWEMHRLQRLCDALQPGTPVKTLRSTIEKYRLWNPLVAWQFEHEDGPGSFDAQRRTWELAIPAPSTYGDMECFVYHDKTTVISREILGP